MKRSKLESGASISWHILEYHTNSVQLCFPLAMVALLAFPTHILLFGLNGRDTCEKCGQQCSTDEVGFTCGSICGQAGSVPVCLRVQPVVRGLSACVNRATHGWRAYAGPALRWLCAWACTTCCAVCSFFRVNYTTTDKVTTTQNF